MPYHMLQYIAETYKKPHKRKDEYREEMFTPPNPRLPLILGFIRPYVSG